MVQSILLSLVAIPLIPIIYWFLKATFKAYQPGLRQVPGPWLAKFSGLWRLYFVFDGNGHESYRTLHKKYGAIVRTAPNVVDISDPSAIATIYSISSKFIKSPFYSVWTMGYKNEAMHSLFATTSPEEHQRLKRSVAQKYSMTAMRGLEYLVDPCSTIFIDAMKDLQGEVVDLGAWLQWYAFDVVGAMSFSRRYGFMEERKDVHNVIAGIDSGLLYPALVGQVPWLHKFLFGNPTVRSMLEALIGGGKSPIPIVTKMVEDSIEESNAETSDTSNRSDFVSYLQEQKKKTVGGMSHRDMVNHLMNNLLAGSDTTAISLRAIFYYLMKNKDVYEKLQKEIDAAEDNLSPIVTFSESMQLVYLQAVMKEAMRMHPGVAFPLERVVPTGGVQLCDKHIPAGTIVGINATVIHRNTDIFGEDADTFRPERWLIKDEEKIKNMERYLLTFGAGSRSCIGKNISIMEMGKLVPQMMRHFDLEWASEEPEWKIHTYWFSKQSGLLVRMKARKR